MITALSFLQKLLPGLFVLILTPFCFAATDDLTLRGALQELPSGSLKLQRVESQKEEAQWKKLEGYALHLPTLTLNGSYLPQHKYLLTDVNLGAGSVSISAITPTAQLSVVAQLPLFNGFRSTFATEAVVRSSNALEKDYEWTQFTVERELILQFYRALAAKELQNAASGYQGLGGSSGPDGRRFVANLPGPDLRTVSQRKSGNGWRYFRHERDDWARLGTGSGWVFDRRIWLACLPLFIWWELRVKNPIINIRLFTQSIVVSGVSLMIFLGFFLYGVVFVSPVFLGTTFHYTPTQMGLLFFR